MTGRQFKNLDDIKNYACVLLIKHDLNDVTFQWHNRIRVLGTASIGRKKLWLSKPIFELNLDNFELVNDVILHEIAHLLCNRGEGHGKNWKAKCIEIGCRPERLSRIQFNRPAQQYKAVCSHCGQVYYRRRKMAVSQACGNCCDVHNNGRYTDTYKLRFEENEV